MTYDDVTDLLAEWRDLADSVDGWAYSESREDEAFSRDAREPFARLLDAVQAVLAYHEQSPCVEDSCPVAMCHCQTRHNLDRASHWPCPTVRAITDALSEGGPTC